ncbi:MAG: flagellar biosynthetic protein FliQ [Armatimonadota bacterium]|nr:flagellar biosynthetic protein FliQ [Armatimonadota bacterium]
MVDCRTQAGFVGLHSPPQDGPSGAGAEEVLTTDAQVLLELTQRALVIALYVALPPLAGAVVAGLLVGAAQSALKQSDPTLAVVPRLLAAGGAVLIFGGWMAALIAGFWVDLWGALPHLLP